MKLSKMVNDATLEKSEELNMDGNIKETNIDDDTAAEIERLSSFGTPEAQQSTEDGNDEVDEDTQAELDAMKAMAGIQ